jgi:hypothetical protein
MWRMVVVHLIDFRCRAGLSKVTQETPGDANGFAARRMPDGLLGWRPNSAELG